jgi:hypothetical protein
MPAQLERTVAGRELDPPAVPVRNYCRAVPRGSRAPSAPGRSMVKRCAQEKRLGLLVMKWKLGVSFERRFRPRRRAGPNAQFQGARAGLGILVWPLGIAATGFLLAATIAVFVVWLPVILFFALVGAPWRPKQIDAGPRLTQFT